LIEVLVRKGFAYEKDGSIYFSISKFKDYGKLSGTNVKGVKAGARVDVDEYEKDNPQDFALWKAEDEKAKQRHEAFDSPWGIGRPGWHIECSAMSTEYLGETFDIHTGGVDLLFPHHENEIAQSEAATGKKFVNYWMEGEHLLVNGEKMAKRLGNIYTLADIIKKGFDPLALRYLFLTAHYRSTLNFTWESLQAAQNALNNVRQLISSYSSSEPSDCHSERSEESRISDDFSNAINQDLDMPRAIALMHETMKSNLSEEQKLGTILHIDKVLGLGLDLVEKAELPNGAKELIKKREESRSMGEFEESDNIRQELAKMGVDVEDTPKGSVWKINKKQH
jgi:cysteinyl-tRNA synthetase